MNDIKNTLTQHAEKYPLMEPTDAVKLIYQNEFGSGHMIADYSSALRRLNDELSDNASGYSDHVTVEPLGGDIVRLHLGLLGKLGLTADNVCRMFEYTANSHSGSAASFEAKLEVLREVTAAGMMPFDTASLEGYLAGYRPDGGVYRAVSHSDAYRAAYAPSYRIVYERFVRLFPVIAATDRLLEERGHAVVAIDGRCASGKTTAAELLSYVFDGAPIVHMDDFFLPPELRTPERYAEPGGNVHYERFADEVVPYIGSSPFSYRVFDCSIGGYSGSADIPHAPVTIVEGSYSLHPAIGRYADLNVFCDIAPDEQMRRIRDRDGDYAEVFRTRWIPLEERYFNACRPVERCDLVLN